MSHTFHKGGVHPPENKITASCHIIEVELPREVVVTFSQHIGAMAVCCRSKGEHVKRGDLIAKASGFVSANVHTPISGTVTRLDKWKTAFGYAADTVTIVADDEDHAGDMASIAGRETLRTAKEVASLSHKDIVEIIDNAGIVGLGGAAFPTKVKLSPPSGMNADMLLINGVECEPYLTNDHALMLAAPQKILDGIKLLMKAAGTDRAVIGIERNKDDAIKLFEKLTTGDPSISVAALDVKYPQGSEKQLIKAVTGREVPSGALPIAAGVIVHNVATAYAVYEAVYLGKPLIERIITVTGPSVKRPGNYNVPIGMNIADLVDIAGGVPADTGKIILGGPMMGRAVVSLDAPTIKGVSGILMLPYDKSHRDAVQPCIRCAACVDACPMGLEPYRLATLSRHKMWDEAEDDKIINCIECGCCSYSCPSSRPILDYIRLGKTTVGSIIRDRQSKK